MPGEGNRLGQTIRGEGEGNQYLCVQRMLVSASTATGAQRGTDLQEREENDALPANVRGPSGERLSAGRGRWRTLPSWLAGRSHRLGGVQGYSPPMATPADTRTQQRPVNRTIETAAQRLRQQPNHYAHCQLGEDGGGPSRHGCSLGSWEKSPNREGYNNRQQMGRSRKPVVSGSREEEP